MSLILDTNILIRYLTGDDPQKAIAVEKLLKSSPVKLTLPDVAVAEMVWVLVSVYKQTREEITNHINALMKLPTIKINQKLIEQTLLNFADKKLGWVDAYLLALIQLGKHKGIYSYDQYFDKIPQSNRREP